MQLKRVDKRKLSQKEVKQQRIFKKIKIDQRNSQQMELMHKNNYVQKVHKPQFSKL